jgi:hypothetical protein
MINIKKMIGICFFYVFISCISTAQENPEEMFAVLYEEYRQSKVENIILSQRSEGSDIDIFDIKKEISEDIFCRITLLGSLGQTQYLVYKKNDENIWYFHKEAYIYKWPTYNLENAEIINTYFKYINDLPYAFNKETRKFDIQADTDKFLAIRDVRTLAYLIEIVQYNVNMYR